MVVLDNHESVMSRYLKSVSFLFASPVESERFPSTRKQIFLQAANRRAAEKSTVLPPNRIRKLPIRITTSINSDCFEKALM